MFTGGGNKARVMGGKIVIGDNEVFSPKLWETTKHEVGDKVMWALHFALMYPRLDEKVSTRRDHLLKMPFCVHPGTGRLCTPLEWPTIAAFHPKRDPPSISALLHELGAIPDEWTAPLTRILDAMEAQRRDAARAKAELKEEQA
jgi:DNA primase catalytic subunit